jgi:hypothetical protein
MAWLRQGGAQRVPDDNMKLTIVTDVDTQQMRRKPVVNGLISEYAHAA